MIEWCENCGQSVYCCREQKLRWQKRDLNGVIAKCPDRGTPQKIAINCQIGGFRLSHKAKVRYAELKGLPLYIEEHYPELYKDREPDPDYEEEWRWDYFTKPKEEREHEYDGALLDFDLDRTDPVLIQVIEELGPKAGWREGSVKVVEVPEGVEWELHESDPGYEWVAEKHRTWS